MSQSTISTFQMFAMFPDQETARVSLESRLWPEGAKCPACKAGERITTRKGGYYRCNACKEIGITQKSAWFVLQRLREACGNDMTLLAGIVEIDEAYFGGKEKNKHAHKRLHLGRGGIGKTAVVGMRERGGRTKAKTVKIVESVTLHAVVHENVEGGSEIHTDEHFGYQGLGYYYMHETVNHRAGEYSRNGITTNGLESVWAVMKRGMHGVYHHASAKHIARYVNEFTSSPPFPARRTSPNPV